MGPSADGARPDGGEPNERVSVPGTRWHRRPDVLWRRTLDAVVVARPEMDGPDPVIIAGGGVAVWELLDEPRSLDRLVADLAGAYRADATVVEADVRAALADLERQGYVVQVRAESASEPGNEAGSGAGGLG